MLSTIAQVSGAVTNIILDPILIFGYFGAPELGVAGAAYATVIGQMVSFVLFVVFQYTCNREVPAGVCYLIPEGKVMKEILSVGFPAIIMQAVGSFLTYGVNVIFGTLSASAVTAYGVYYKIQQFAFFAAFGMNNAMIPVIAFNYGSGDKERVRAGIRWGMIDTLVIMGVCLVVLEVCASQIVGIFALTQQTLTLCTRAVRTIALGYLSVSFAFGIQATSLGLTPLQAVMISFFNVTSAGQLAGLQLMAAGAGLAEMALTQLTINLRYALMSLSLSQKLDSSMTLPHRLLLSFCNTDEVFVVASQQPGKVGRAYLYGLTNGPFLGWVLGTLLGALAGGFLPAAVTEALGIAIYGMFIAIVLPPFRRSREVRAVVLVAVGLSCLISLWPVLSFISDGFRIILCAVAASALGAWLMPRPFEEEAADKQEAL